ncbi:MAG: plasmid pRiA4b ORF-3 family protein [Methanobrevibacter sp.]|nr:plasmid pRiA4b ORF-3 family protein [Methanobrevibacter sp.]
MENIKNDHIVEVVENILEYPGDTMPLDLAEELMDYLCDATLICPSNDDGGIMFLQLGPNIFLPACCDIDDFKRIFKNQTPISYEFNDFSGFMDDVDGIILNPGSFGFIVNTALSQMIFAKINNREKTNVLKGYDVKVRLDDFRPLTWRDLIIPAGITFKELDNIMKILWDFSGYHLSRFTFKDSWDVITNEFEDIGFNLGELNSKEIIIDDYFENNKKLYWEYDYGDGWSFTIEVKKTVEYDKDYPLIKRYKGDYNPQDDIGGVWGLERLINENPSQLTKFNQEDIQWELKDFKNPMHYI